MDNQQILEAWRIKLLYAYPKSGSGRAIRAFLANPASHTSLPVGLYADGGASHLAGETLTALGKLGSMSVERSNFLTKLAFVRPWGE